MWKRIVLLLIVLACLLASACANRASRYNSLGIKAAKYDLWREATVRFKQASALRPNDGRIHNNLGVAYEAQGMMDKAEQEYTRAVQLQPGLQAAKDNLRSFADDQIGIYTEDDAEK